MKPETSQTFFHLRTRNGAGTAIMCGRYSLTKPIKTLKEHFQAIAVEMDHNKRYNIAPSQSVPIVIAGEQEREIHAMRWGLIPPGLKIPLWATN